MKSIALLLLLAGCLPPGPDEVDQLEADGTADQVALHDPCNGYEPCPADADLCVRIFPDGGYTPLRAGTLRRGCVCDGQGFCVRPDGG